MPSPRFAPPPSHFFLEAATSPAHFQIAISTGSPTTPFPSSLVRLHDVLPGSGSSILTCACVAVVNANVPTCACAVAVVNANVVPVTIVHVWVANVNVTVRRAFECVAAVVVMGTSCHHPRRLLHHHHHHHHSLVAWEEIGTMVFCVGMATSTSASSVESGIVASPWVAVTAVCHVTPLPSETSICVSEETENRYGGVCAGGEIVSRRFCPCPEIAVALVLFHHRGVCCGWAADLCGRGDSLTFHLCHAAWKTRECLKLMPISCPCPCRRPQTQRVPLVQSRFLPGVGGRDEAFHSFLVDDLVQRQNSSQWASTTLADPVRAAPLKC